MKAEITTFRVFPSVVLADRESEISIIASEGVFSFFDDVEYKVWVIPTDESDIPEDETLTIYGLDKKRPYQTVKPEGGVLKFKYYFSGEQEWHIKICAVDYSAHYLESHKKASPHWDSIKKRAKDGVILAMYSLYPDLYERTPKRCDLHVHTNYSDGNEGPSLTAAAYRRAGYDRIAITDHTLYDIGKYARDRMDFKSDYRVLVGEEIHNAYNGQLHIICLEAREHISRMLIEESERVAEEVAELEVSVKVPEGLPKKEYLYRLWVYKTAKANGGFVIYPHPYWNIGKCRWQVGPKLAKAIMTDGLCDAFEIMGGGNTVENNMQVMQYYDAIAEGLKLPVVGSTDNHSVMDNFDTASTVVFEKDGDLCGAIKENYSIAADHKRGEMFRLFGPYRLARYTRFLFDYYFPRHTELCASSGQMMVDYMMGYSDDRELVERLEKRVDDFEKLFFGRE